MQNAHATRSFAHRWGGDSLALRSFAGAFVTILFEILAVIYGITFIAGAGIGIGWIVSPKFRKTIIS
jgi:hypothetical protein